MKRFDEDQELKTVKKTGIVALMSLVALLASTVARASGEVEVLGLKISSSNLHFVLLTLGQPEAVYLAASGPDGTTLPDDSIILEYQADFDLAGVRDARILVKCDDTTYLVESIRIEIAEDELGTTGDLRAAVERAYGERYVEFHREIVCDDGDTECTLSDCRSPDGDVLVWRFAAAGLEVQVQPRDREVSAWLVFDPGYAAEVVPECPR